MSARPVVPTQPAVDVESTALRNGDLLHRLFPPTCTISSTAAKVLLFPSVPSHLQGIAFATVGYAMMLATKLQDWYGGVIWHDMGARHSGLAPLLLFMRGAP